MTKSNESHGSRENTGNVTTTHNPKAPGEVEKVDPTTGDTTTEDTNPEKPAA